MSDIRVGISTPWDLPSLDGDTQRDRLRAIADAGIDHVFTADHASFVNGSGIDAPVRLARIAHLGHTEGLLLGKLAHLDDRVRVLA